MNRLDDAGIKDRTQEQAAQDAPSQGPLVQQAAALRQPSQAQHKRTVGRDMTQGSILSHLIAFATPMLIGNALQAFYNTVDSMWVGRFLGPASLAAVSVSFPVIFVLVSLVMGVTMATTVLVAQNVGAKRMDVVRKVINNSVALLVIAGSAVSILGVLIHKKILALINVPPEIMPEASSYLSIILAGLVFMFGYNVFGAILRGLGDSRTPLLFLTYATVMNIILDPLMIFGVWPFPRMGVAGAAAATVISQAFSGALAWRYMLKKSNLLGRSLSDYRIDPELSKATLRVGLPVGVQQMVMSVGMLVVSSVINSFGETVVAGFGAGARLDQFAVMPAMSVGLAVSGMVGQNLGAGKHERVREIVMRAGAISVSIACVFLAVAMLAPRLVLSIFTTSPEVLDTGTTYLRIASLTYVPFAIMVTTNGVMRGAGDTFATMVISISTLWLVRVPLARYLSSLPSLGSNGVWWAMVASSLMGMVLSVAYYSTGRWKHKVLVRRPPDELAVELVEAE